MYNRLMNIVSQSRLKLTFIVTLAAVVVTLILLGFDLYNGIHSGNIVLSNLTASSIGAIFTLWMHSWNTYFKAREDYHNATKQNMPDNTTGGS